MSTLEEWKLTAGTSYVMTRPRSGLRLVESQIAQSRRRSQFLRRIDAIQDLVAKICALKKLDDNWDSYGAVAPSLRTVELAAKFSAQFALSESFPSRVMPSAEGGVAFRFSRNDRRALLEFLNSGDVELILYSRAGQVQATTLNSSMANEALPLIEAHLAR